MTDKAKRAIKISAISVGGAIGAVVLAVAIYLLYVVCGYYRIADDLPLDIAGNMESTADINGEYSIVTYNVGFGAYGPDYTFFMDTGEMKDGTETSGKYGKAKSKDDVLKNINGSIATVTELSPDFAIIQEVDYDSTRSYKVDQRSMFQSIEGYCSVFAENYHSGYLMYPFSDPHGKNNAGIVTLSKYKMSESKRYSFPIADDLSKYTDLDRCFSITHIPVGEGTLSVISLHMSAYDEGGVIRKKQAELLKSALAAEYEKGYYVIAGGDFNQDLLGDPAAFDSEQKVPDWVASYDAENIPEHFSIFADRESDIGSCRGADVVYERGKTYTCMIDGFIVSDNINVKSVKVIDTDFAYSDHMPVEMMFTFV